MKRRTTKDPSEMWAIENSLRTDEYRIICGVDEAGRGCLCGPVYAGAVILPDGICLEGVTDSKKLSPEQRDKAFDLIAENAVAWAVGTASPEETDEINILNATFLAMRRAVDALAVKPDLALIDGNRAPKLDTRCVCVVKGDSKSMNIAAASIMAKVSRDRFMCDLAKRYPQYRLEEHKGYPTKEHYAMLGKYGVESFYRKTFLKNLDEHLAELEQTE